MQFRFSSGGQIYNISSSIRVKDETGNYKQLDTTVIMGQRFVSNYSKSSDKQTVRVSSSSGVFKDALIKNGGKALVVVIDRAQGIINPYISINGWANRSSEKKDNDVEITSVIYPGDISALPDTIPLDSSAEHEEIVSKTPDAQKITSTGHSKFAVAATATLAAALIGSKTDNQKRDSAVNFPNVTFEDKDDDDRNSIIKRLRRFVG